VGFIALAGVAVETAVVTLAVPERRLARACRSRTPWWTGGLRTPSWRAPLLRLRPKMMTVATIIADLIPLLLGTGPALAQCRRIAARW